MDLRLPGRRAKAITLYGNPVLAAAATPVTQFDRHLRSLVGEMFETMYATGHGVGLAANQIGRSESVFVFDTADDEIGCVINPVVTPVGSETQEGIEGCLSLPGISHPTTRWLNCVVTGQDVKGNDVSYEGTELAARCFQHEADHLNGLTYLHCQTDEDRQMLISDMQGFDWWGESELDPKSAIYFTTDE